MKTLYEPNDGPLNEEGRPMSYRIEAALEELLKHAEENDLSMRDVSQLVCDKVSVMAARRILRKRKEAFDVREP